MLWGGFCFALGFWFSRQNLMLIPVDLELMQFSRPQAWPDGGLPYSVSWQAPPDTAGFSTYQPREFILVSISERKERKEKNSTKNPEIISLNTQVSGLRVSQVLITQRRQFQQWEPRSAGFYGKAKGIPHWGRVQNILGTHRTQHGTACLEPGSLPSGAIWTHPIPPPLLVMTRLPGTLSRDWGSK